VAAVLQGAGAFLAEVLSPYEMTHEVREAVSALRHLNEIWNLSQAHRSALHDEAGQLLVAVHLALADLTEIFRRYITTGLGSAGAARSG